MEPYYKAISVKHPQKKGIQLLVVPMYTDRGIYKGPSYHHIVSEEYLKVETKMIAIASFPKYWN
jgi:hypothetical protein